VELASLGKNQIAYWLSATAGAQEAALRSAASHLEAAQSVPKFAHCLLMLAAGKCSMICSIMLILEPSVMCVGDPRMDYMSTI
jgi:hypothetical protein